MDKFEEWELDAESEDESVMESFSEEMLRLLNSDDAEDKTEDENALWDDPEAEPEDKPKPDSREKDVFEVEQDEVEQAQDLYGEVDADDDGVCYDSITQHPIYRMLIAANKSSSQKRLIRELKKDALERIEFAARSVRDYKQIVRRYTVGVENPVTLDPGRFIVQIANRYSIGLTEADRASFSLKDGFNAVALPL